MLSAQVFTSTSIARPSMQAGHGSSLKQYGSQRMMPVVRSSNLNFKQIYLKSDDKLNQIRNDHKKLDLSF
jgi:hypothetical protein